MTVPEIDRQTLLRRLHAGEAIEVVDIRETNEYNGWHIAGASNVPTYIALNRQHHQPFLEQITSYPKDRELVMVCRRGNTSKLAALLAQKLGYQALSLQGGMADWSNAWTVAPATLQNAAATFLQIRRDGKGCLSYLLGAANEAAVFDPNIEENAYLELAEKAGLKIRWIFETHIHADHLSRARGLAQKTGATLIMPATSSLRTSLPFQPIQDGETFRLGAIEMRAIATPGHTTESTCYLVNGEALISGDTLFVESIGRPDLEKGDAGAVKGAELLFDSLHQRLLTLPDAVQIFPAHYSGAIKFNAEPLTAQLGELRGKIALLKAEKEAFVKTVVASLPAKPPNHEMIISINEGKATIDDLGFMSPADLEAGPNRCAVQ
ncbi:MBL fold metallo-hydrolase [candidate division KSB1 bacterium]|nr:MBL fold metallo-hydrolase [candidate division KSB1 bacterium]